MDINLIYLPFLMYACFVPQNYCEATKETMDEQTLRQFSMTRTTSQPHTNFRADCITAEGKRVRIVLTEFLDP